MNKQEMLDEIFREDESVQQVKAAMFSHYQQHIPEEMHVVLFEALGKIIRDVYDESLTDDEVLCLLEMHRSPHGRSIRQKMPHIMYRMGEELEIWRQSLRNTDNA